MSVDVPAHAWRALVGEREAAACYSALAGGAVSCNTGALGSCTNLTVFPDGRAKLYLTAVDECPEGLIAGPFWLYSYPGR
jgi:hypothetical protein